MKKTLQEVLLYDIPADRYVEIRDHGWRVGFTYIDYEDLFIESLNPAILNRRVEDLQQITDQNFTVKIYRVDIK